MTDRALAAPPLTVWLGSAMYTFPAGREVTVGRGDQCDIRVDVPERQAISRVHAVLRYDGQQWVAVDNKSRNGIYSGGARQARVLIDDDVDVTLGAPDGPRLTFRTGSQQLNVISSPVAPGPWPSNPPPSRPATGAMPAPPAHRPPPQPRPVPRRTPPGPPRPATPPAPQPPRGAAPVTGPRPAPVVPQPAPDEDLLGRVTGAVKRVVRPTATPAPAGALSVGRSASNTIVVDDALASRVHAYLVAVPGGMELRDNRSSNGTFVNGERVTSIVLRPGDTVAVGNTDLTFTGTTLTPKAATPQAGGLQAYQLGLVVDDDKSLLSNVSFSAGPGTLTAVIGPSGAGKSTLIKLLGGATQPTTGVVSFDGHNVQAEYASLRSRIGMVPQDDVVHRQLTVTKALNYAAQLRLPPDTSSADRKAVVARVLAELELTEHADKRVDKLSGGQRKRVSVAMELLTGPSLLILDEPTSGLDPALDRQVMSMLRRLADAGRVVVVVTHSLTYLSMCDQVLLLAPGGKTAFAGPPGQIAAAMGTSDWADIFAWVSTNPDAAQQAYLGRNPSAAKPPKPSPAAGPLGQPARTSSVKQMLTVLRRQGRLLVADRGYFLFLAVLPFILGALSLVVPGDVGLGEADPRGSSPNEPTQVLILLNISAVFMGTALTLRDLVGERPIFRREQAVGLSAGAYLVAKVVVYSIAAAAQVAILTAIVVAGKGGPTQGALALGDATAELYVALAITAIVSALLGLLLSSIAKSSEQILPMLVAAIMLSIVFSGGLIPVTARVGLDQVSWFLPARWGFAASAATVDLLKIAPLVTVDDPLWRHEATWWLFDIAMLILLGIAFTLAVRWRLRLPSLGASATDADSRKGVPGWLVAVVALLAAAALVAALSVVTRGGGTRDPQAAPDIPEQGPAPTQEVIAPAQLQGLLLDPTAVGSVMAALAGATAQPLSQFGTATVTPPECAGAADAGNTASYAASGFTGVAGRRLTDPGEPRVVVDQYVSSYPDADAAAIYQDEQINAWQACTDTTVGVGTPPAAVRQFIVGPSNSEDGRLTVNLTEDGNRCQRALLTDSNVVIDVRACGPDVDQQAGDLAAQIADKIS
ncbi:ATP-binding cassette domain-containing protein [Mycobacterium sp. NPDC050041]|uniref:ATP-binding cassette domain-containing protein n=1 Tax=Mycobacterium sp. NPDC050041 TaxID=3364293 RepID=UPI003C2E5354